jgi:hypothetical protein
MSAQPVWLNEEFRLTKRDRGEVRTLVCELWRYPLGWKLRLVIDGVGLEAFEDVRAEALIQTRVSILRERMLVQGWR